MKAVLCMESRTGTPWRVKRKKQCKTLNCVRPRLYPMSWCVIYVLFSPFNPREHCREPRKKNESTPPFPVPSIPLVSEFSYHPLFLFSLLHDEHTRFAFRGKKIRSCGAFCLRCLVTDLAILIILDHELISLVTNEKLENNIARDFVLVNWFGYVKMRNKKNWLEGNDKK